MKYVLAVTALLLAHLVQSAPPAGSNVVHPQVCVSRMFDTCDIDTSMVDDRR